MPDTRSLAIAGKTGHAVAGKSRAGRNDYQQKLITSTNDSKRQGTATRETIRGTASSEPSLLTTETQMKARQDDIVCALSKMHNTNPTDPAGTRLVTPSPFSTLATNHRRYPYPRPG